ARSMLRGNRTLCGRWCSRRCRPMRSPTRSGLPCGEGRAMPETNESMRRAAALEALRQGQPAVSPQATFWQRHGGKIVLAAVVLLVIWIGARAVGRFMQASVSETGRAQDQLREGM